MMPIRLRLIQELISKAPPGACCPHLAVDEAGCRCASPGCPEDSRLLVTDCLSLQIWCLAGPERWPACFVFPNG